MRTSRSPQEAAQELLKRRSARRSLVEWARPLRLDTLIGAATDLVQTSTGRQVVAAQFLYTLRDFPDCLSGYRARP